MIMLFGIYLSLQTFSYFCNPQNFTCDPNEVLNENHLLQFLCFHRRNKFDQGMSSTVVQIRSLFRNLSLEDSYLDC